MTRPAEPARRDVAAVYRIGADVTVTAVRVADRGCGWREHRLAEPVSVAAGETVTAVWPAHGTPSVHSGGARQLPAG